MKLGQISTLFNSIDATQKLIIALLNLLVDKDFSTSEKQDEAAEILGTLALESDGNLESLTRQVRGETQETLQEILTELRTHSVIFQSGMNVRDEIESIRDSQRLQG